MAQTHHTQDTPLASGLAENVAMGGRPRPWLCGVAVAAVEVAVRGGCALGNATVRPSGFWPYCTGWNNLDACGQEDIAAAQAWGAPEQQAPAPAPTARYR